MWAHSEEDNAAPKSRADVEKSYEIGRTIGDGNFAVVMECHHRSTNQNYAMKIIDKSKLKGKEDMLENEILIIKSLSHPNIVSLIEVFETDGCTCWVCSFWTKILIFRKWIYTVGCER
uniref:Protein kinase domain-containing protein n=1 Tax=Podarcis muralis TaxID=64176 RepID=A0A670JXW1_PODMU